jgi:hypothetical protein
MLKKILHSLFGKSGDEKGIRKSFKLFVTRRLTINFLEGEGNAGI